MTLGEIVALLRLDEGPKRVLVVEDAREHYDAMLRWLREEGHTVSAFGELHALENGCLLGRTLYGDPVSVKISSMDVAFLDFYFPRTPWSGGRVARALIAGNPQIRIMGMSSVASKNAELVREGAMAAILKRDLTALLDAD